MVLAQKLRCLLSEKPGDLSLILYPFVLGENQLTLENCTPTSYIHTMMCNPLLPHPPPPHTHTL